jgi:transcriptional regulator with XRE-family HTH domain
MARGKRRAARDLGVREANAIAANLGREARRTRILRRWTQSDLGDRIGLSQAEISKLEGGRGARTSIEAWVAIGIALARPIAIGFTRDTVEPLNDAGHLDAQELVARLAKAGGWRVTFEAPDDARAPIGSTDLRLERERAVLVEIWNRVDDLGAAARSSDRKLARAPARPGSFWLLVDTAANHAIVRRFPAILRARFPGSSRGWIRAITTDALPPSEPGIAWIDLRSGRLRELRLWDD